MRRAALAFLLLLGLGITPVLAASEQAAPTVSITSPAPGFTIATDEVDVTAAFSAPSGMAISQVELLVDGVVVQTATLDPAEETGELTLTWQASGYLEGKHQVVMRVTDSQGHTAKATIPTTLKRGLPEPPSPIKISAPARNTTVSGTVDFRVDTDPGVKYVIFLVDNVFKAMSNIRPFIYSWDTTNYLNGLHRLQARAYLSDGTDALSRAFTVQVNNPGGATAMKPAPAVTAVPAPKPTAAPARTAAPVLPPARLAVSPTPYSAPAAVARAEVGAPGTAPYVNSAGELVTPPTTALAERTPAGTDAKAATVAEASETTSAPATAAGASVSAPPAPSPTSVPAESAVTASPASTEAAAGATSPAVAPMQVVALPTPASTPERTAAAEALPAPRAPEATPPAEVPSAPVASDTATATPPQPTPPAVTPATPEAAPATVGTPAAPKESAAPASESKPLPLLGTIPIVGRLYVSPAKPAAKAPKSEPVQVALLPVQPAAELPAPTLTPEPKPVTSVMVNGSPLPADAPMQVLNGPGGQVHLLPLRAVVESLGGIVLWQHETKQATVDARGNRVVVTIQRIEAQVNGKTVHMVVAPVIVEGRTLVQARFLAKALDLSLDIQDGVMQLAAN